jgi:hypothetical protein
MPAWVKCKNTNDEDVYLNMSAATVISPLTTGLTRVMFREAQKGFVDVKESPEALIAAAVVARP